MAQRCSVCAHPRRAEIDAVLRSEHNLVEVGRDFDVTRYAVRRHRERHLTAPTGRPRRLVEEVEDVFDDVPLPVPSSTARLDPQTAFLTSFAANGDLKDALKAAGITRPQLRKWQEHDEGFALRFHQAETEAVEALEAEARIRAVAGSKLVRRVFRHGMLYEEIHEFRPSDTMLVKLLQAHKPEKYSDKLSVTQTTVVKALDASAWEQV